MISTAIKWFAIIAVFCGILGPLILDIIIFFSSPSMQNLQKLGYDVAKTMVDSQGVIVESIDAMKTTYDYGYRSYLIYRIISGSLISAFLIYIAYKGLSMILLEPLLALILAFAVMGFLLWIFSGMLGSSHPFPFYGWYYLIKNYDVVYGVMRNVTK